MKKKKGGGGLKDAKRRRDNVKIDVLVDFSLFKQMVI